MIILDLELENFGVIQAARIETNGKPVIELAGLNAQGKSTCLEAILSTFLGTKKLPARPVRVGAKEAKVVCTTDRYQITQVITKKRNRIEVIDMTSGEEVKSPRTLLASLLQAKDGGKSIAIDPIEFVNMKPEQRTQTILEAIGVYDRVVEIDKSYKEEYEARRDHNKEVKKYEQQLSGLVHDPKLPRDLVNLSMLMNELTAVNEHNASYAQTQEDIVRGQDRLKDIDAQIAKLEKDKEIVSDALANLIENVEDAGSIDAGPITEAIEAAGATNQRIIENTNIKKLEDLRTEQDSLSSMASETLDDLKTEKLQLLDKSKLPLASLSFDEEGLLLVDDIPFDQASQAEQYEIATALAFAKNPELKVVLLFNGGLIGDAILARMEAIAVREGGQLWVERPLRNKGYYKAARADGAIIIEDGLIAEDDNVYTKEEDGPFTVEIDPPTPFTKSDQEALEANPPSISKPPAPAPEPEWNHSAEALKREPYKKQPKPRLPF